MEQIKRRTRGVTIVSIIIFIFGLMMVGYWTSYIFQGLPLKGIPLGSELVAAVLAIITAIGLFRMRPWSLATALILCGLWIYGVVGGINLIIENGLDFESPVGALTDAILFVIVLIFSVYNAVFLWRRYPLLLASREHKCGLMYGLHGLGLVVYHPDNVLTELIAFHTPCHNIPVWSRQN